MQRTGSSCPSRVTAGPWLTDDQGDSMSLSDFEHDVKERNAVLDAATVAVGLRNHRRLARRTGLLESYAAEWRYWGGCLDPRGMVRTRVKRYSVRATMKAEVFEGWEDAPTDVKRRYLSA